VVVALFAVVGRQGLKEYGQFREKEIQLREKIEAEKMAYEQKRDYYRKLMNDPAFLEAVVRERLGYARDDEIIFVFEDEGP